MRAGWHVDLRRHIAFLVVMLGLVVAGWLLSRNHPFQGLAFAGATLVVASGLRTLLPTRYGGLLVNRSRRVDAAILGLLGATIIVLVASLRNSAP